VSGVQDEIAAMSADIQVCHSRNEYLREGQWCVYEWSGVQPTKERSRTRSSVLYRLQSC
jgi:hypothetical protein